VNPARNPAAGDHIPWFLPGPDGSDGLLIASAVIVAVVVLLIGVLFFTLHSLPERMGHKKFQFEIVAVLGLLSLFTHIHLFWVIGLLLALIDIPDFTTPLRRIASAVETISGSRASVPVADEPPATTPAPAKEA
jgi:hypothetical protein